MHLRPADFFTSNPALDVPSKRNEASVLVPCCGGTNGETAAAKNGEASVQDSPLTHLQGSAPDIDAKQAGASVENGDGEKASRRLSRALTGLFKKN
jgi:primary-amine oxidase